MPFERRDALEKLAGAAGPFIEEHSGAAGVLRFQVPHEGLERGPNSSGEPVAGQGSAAKRAAKVTEECHFSVARFLAQVLACPPTKERPLNAPTTAPARPSYPSKAGRKSRLGQNLG